MWEQYRKTLLGMQIVICAVTAAVYINMGHRWFAALVFFVTMQISALIGAMWASRLKGRFAQRSAELPLRPKA